MCYAPNYPNQFRRVAGLMDKILRGAKPVIAVVYLGIA